jgi:hypothetical protein
MEYFTGLAFDDLDGSNEQAMPFNYEIDPDGPKIFCSVRPERISVGFDGIRSETRELRRIRGYADDVTCAVFGPSIGPYKSRHRLATAAPMTLHAYGLYEIVDSALSGEFTGDHDQHKNKWHHYAFATETFTLEWVSAVLELETEHRDRTTE